ncbi:Acyl-CoA N-acyltransferases (NAT) superfamily protein [Rhynchospora pubera]|uniref:Acyl-CoA N-acyltransferases (NAT) superfamily protein n=1 Tax=Rhynchospora pubera TaxID=906938 RepID=A0AAV8F1B5_9POAL|nr:Acyl-CoA N-acyltransferases (NAT) superfamily protein [Rhynchospora pubera]
MSLTKEEARDCVKIRPYNKETDLEKVLNLERNCEVGSKKRPILVIDSMGDPLCRIRNSPLYLMMVAESGNDLVGVVCGSIKIATTGGSSDSQAKLGYILGLRVLTRHRRRGIGRRLVLAMEHWFCLNQVDYAYMATERDNEASINLFTYKLGYTKFRTPTILVNPVGNKPGRIDPNVAITKLEVSQAESLYRRHMSSLEFFPQDIDQVLSNKLSLGTWVACRRGESWSEESNWAMISVWNCPYRIRVARLPFVCLFRAKILRHLERLSSCFKRIGIPNIFSFFRFYIIYGAHAEGPEAARFMQALCVHARNMAMKQEGYTIVLAEVGGGDGIRYCIPHRRDMSFSSDIWCIKDLKEGKKESFDWNSLPPCTSIFLDPREF